MKNTMLKNLFIVTTMLFAVIGAGSMDNADTKAEAINKLSRHFTAVPTMTGEFIQFGPNGEQTGGEFYIQRPGKIRFDYEDPSPLMLISNGKTLGVRNAKLKTWQYIPLRKTPLSLLLAKQLKVDDESVREIQAGEDVTRVVMGDKNIFGDSEITLLFDPNTFDLRQWTIKDNQGKETSVMIFNVQKNVRIPEKTFALRKSRPTTSER
ncbi:MAG: outer-membrane lipoprotein carrier protein LolA [Pseudomonadota bacterium]